MRALTTNNLIIVPYIVSEFKFPENILLFSELISLFSTHITTYKK